MRALAGLARCERPTRAPASASTVQPGRFAQGPEEKLGLAGRTSGRAAWAAAISVMLLHPYRWASLVGEGWPTADVQEPVHAGKRRREPQTRDTARFNRRW